MKTMHFNFIIDSEKGYWEGFFPGTPPRHAKIRTLLQF